jgi:hypothetical protein
MTNHTNQADESIGPELPKVPPEDWIGSMKEKMKILGDIIAPASDESDWEVLDDNHVGV